MRGRVSAQEAHKVIKKVNSAWTSVLSTGEPVEDDDLEFKHVTTTVKQDSEKKLSSLLTVLRLAKDQAKRVRVSAFFFFRWRCTERSNKPASV